MSGPRARPSPEAIRTLLLELYAAGLAAVDGERAVREALRRQPLPGPVAVVALGKAAAAMCRGALDVLDARVVSGLVVTKHGHGDAGLAADRRLQCLEASHPLPDASSLAAGRALLEFLDASPPGLRYLFLLSGGASALVEALPAGVSAEHLRRLNEWLLASGLDIHQMNRLRKAVSCIKGGRLAARLRGHDTTVLALSDVPGGDLASLGSGPLVRHGAGALRMDAGLPGWVREIAARAPPLAPEAAFRRIRHRVVADNARARRAVLEAAAARGLEAVDRGEVDGDGLELGTQLASPEAGVGGLQIRGGETTLRLPADPGRGGRCQSLALAAALALDGSPGRVLLAAGTDGTDGPTAEAGAVVDGETVRRGELAGLDARAHLAGADAGTFLAATGDLIRTGPTGTNVMDLILLWADDGS